MRCFIFLRTFFCFALLSLTLSSVAAAQEQSSEHERALARMKQGVQFYKVGNYKIAKQYFEESYALRPAFDVACLLAQTHFKLEAYTESLNYYHSCVQQYPNSGDEEKLEKIRKDRDVALKYVGSVKIGFPEAGMTVLLNGEKVGATPLERDLYVEPGNYQVEVVNPDGRKVMRSFSVKAGERREEKFENFVPLEPSQEPSELQEISPEASDAESAPIADSSQIRYNWVPAYVLGGVTVATLASSVVLRVVAGNKKNKVERLHNVLMPGDCVDSEGVAECEELDSLAKSQRSLGIASNVTMITSGVFAGATLGWIIYELVRPKETKTSTMNMEPLLDVGAQRAWVGLRGQF